MARTRIVLALVAGAVAVTISLVLYVFSINSVILNSTIPITIPRISTSDAIQIIQDDMNKQERAYLNDNRVTIRITDIAINRTTIAQPSLGYVSLEEFNQKNMKLPLVYIHTNRTVFLISENGYRSMGECYTGLSTYCGYLPPFNLPYQGRLLYGAELQVTVNDGKKGPDLYAVDATNGEIVDSMWLRNEHFTKYPGEG